VELCGLVAWWQLLNEFARPELQTIIERFREREIKQRSKFERSLKKFNIGCLQEFETGLMDSLQGVSVQQTLHAGLSLLSDLEIGVHELYHGSTTEKRLHDIRTKLKDINYLNNIFSGQLPVADQLKISIERLREIGEIAGAWHDCLNLENKLGKYTSKHPEETESLEEIIKEIKTKKQGLLQEYSCILMNEMKI